MHRPIAPRPRLGRRVALRPCLCLLLVICVGARRGRWRWQPRSNGRRRRGGRRSRRRGRGAQTTDRAASAPALRCWLLRRRRTALPSRAREGGAVPQHPPDIVVCRAVLHRCHRTQGALELCRPRENARPRLSVFHRRRDAREGAERVARPERVINQRSVNASGQETFSAHHASCTACLPRLSGRRPRLRRLCPHR